MDALAEELRGAAEFRSALQRFQKRTDEITREAGLTVPRYQLLLMIKASPNEESTVTQLSRRLHLGDSTAVELVSRAAVLGLVERHRSSTDRRVVLVRLTEEGNRRLLRAFEALRAERASLAKTFREVERAFRGVARARSEA